MERSATSQTLEVDTLPGGGDVYCRQLDKRVVLLGASRKKNGVFPAKEDGLQLQGRAHSALILNGLYSWRTHTD